MNGQQVMKDWQVALAITLVMLSSIGIAIPHVNLYKSTVAQFQAPPTTTQHGLVIGIKYGNGATTITVGNLTVIANTTAITILPINLTAPLTWHPVVAINTGNVTITIKALGNGTVSITIGPIRPPPGPAGACALVPGQGSACITGQANPAP